eukprot:NODE_115_length_18417_cov_0.666012.p12 type:complete len:251 gc:universal NODE_115_length_18417_cov_0.666012:4255-5007(+)
MDFSTELIIASMLLGGSSLFFVQGLFKSFLVLPLSGKLIITLTGVITSGCDAFLVFLFLYYSNGEDAIIGVFMSILWFLMIQATTWIYTLRIVTLGKPHAADKYVKLIPFAFIIIEIPAAVTIALEGFNIKYHPLYLDVSLAFTIIAIILELFMYTILVKKTIFLMKYSSEPHKGLVKNVKIAMAILIAAKFLIVVAKLLGSSLDMSMRPFTQLVRIYIILQFYGDTFLELDNACKNRRYDSSYEDTEVN